MPPRGLTRERVIEAAAGLADREGLANVSLAALAADVGVRTPSLYNHVRGLPDLQRELSLRGLRMLGDRLRRAAVGRAGGQAVTAVAAAYRSFAHDHPGLYAATLTAPDASDDALCRAADDVLVVVVDALRAFVFDETEVVHAARTLRSALHGFASLEAAGGFGLDVDVDGSFDWMVERLVQGLAGANG